MKTITPNITHGIVNRMTDPIYNYQAWPTVVIDERGTIYAVASGFRVRHVCPFGKTVLYISRDGGTTWSEPIVVNDSELDDRDAGILYLGAGKLLLSWFTRSGKDYLIPKYEKLMRTAPLEGQEAIFKKLAQYEKLPPEVLERGSYVRLSEDYGQSWSDPVKVPITAPHGPNVCADGTLVYLGTEHYSGGELPQRTNAVYTSRNQGKTWDFAGIFPVPEWSSAEMDFCEPHIIELPNGEFLGAIRIDGDGPMTIALARSSNGGKIWTQPQKTGIIGAPPHLMRHSSGALILSYGRREKPYGQRAAVSYDEGKTWETEYILDTCEHSLDLGYPSTVELADGSLLTVYYQKCPNDDYCSILYAKWNLEERQC